jgi:hypothetical protein
MAKNKKMTVRELKAILDSERSSALASQSSSKLSSDRQDALDYYMGDMKAHLPVAEGRSSAVSTDVADTVEGLMPSLMDIFCGSERPVRFDPVSKEDVAAAEQETDYCNHVFMTKNPGFLVLYSMIKDALLSKVGIAKVYWHSKEREERETYLDQDDMSFQMLVSQPGVELVAHSMRPDPYAVQPQAPLSPAQPVGPGAAPSPPTPELGAAGAPTMPGAAPPAPPGQQMMMPPAPPPMLHDLTIVYRYQYECAKVEPVPPEEFGISRHARSIQDTTYCFHEIQKPQSELLDQGYDEDVIKKLPTYRASETGEQQARDTVDESRSSDGGDTINDAARLVTVTEHYVMLDYEGDGKARLYRVTTGGTEAQGDILTRDGEEDIVEVDMIPFAGMTPVIVTHRFYGRSVADLVMDIQRIKTALLRALLDNAYLANNPRTEIAESHASENTIDDLLVSRPGGVVRTKQPGGLNTLSTPPIGGHVFPMLEYLDTTREWRTGVTRQGQGIDANVLQNQSATAVVQQHSAAQARMKLIARIFAETGIKDLFSLLHATIRKNGSKADTVRLRNEWISVDPREWKERTDMTVKVGLGSGGKSERLQGVMMIAGMQEKAITAGLTNLVTTQNLYNTGKELVKLNDHAAVEEFFTDPSTQPPPKEKPDPKMMQLQAQAEIEKTQALADIETQKNKTQAEIVRDNERAKLDAQQRVAEHQFKVEEHKMKMLEMMMKLATSPQPQGENGNGQMQSPEPDFSRVEQLLTMMQPKPRRMRLVRDANNRISHTEPMD